jgi:hypothetical protein
MVIDHLAANNDGPKVIYLYFKGEDTTIQNSLTEILSMLVKQLCWNIEVLPEKVLEFYRKSESNARQPTSNDLKALFTECLNCLGKTFLVFDGLDEYEERQRTHLLKFVNEAVSQQLNMKIFITSRDEIDIKHTLRRCQCSSIEIYSQTQGDVVKVVRHRVANELGHIDAESKEEIIKLLIEKSGGL